MSEGVSQQQATELAKSRCKCVCVCVCESVCMCACVQVRKQKKTYLRAQRQLLLSSITTNRGV